MSDTLNPYDCPRCGQHESYGCSCTRIEQLKAQLDKVTAERDGLGALLADAYGAILDWDEVLKDRADQEAIAAIPRAYRMGIEDAAEKSYYSECGEPTVSWMASPERGFEKGYQKSTEQIEQAIRAIPTPTDLVERVMKEGE